MKETNKHHGKILAKLLIDKELSKSEFCKLINHSEKNYSMTFNKPVFPEKIIKEIGEALKIDTSIFFEKDTEGGIIAPQIINGNGNYISQNIHLQKENELLREQLKAKDKIIELLEQSLKNK